MMPRAYSRRELGRATLARQLLLERAELDPLDVIDHLAGLQAQTTQSWYQGLWCRLRDFDPDTVSAALEDRTLVRATLMRGTIHLVSRDDALAWARLFQPLHERMIGSSFKRFLTGLDLDEVTAEGMRLLATGPLAQADLGRGLQERWPDRDRLALVMAVRGREPLIQATPRGLWGRSGLARLAPMADWLSGRPDAKPDIDRLLLRYLTAFGPASVMDAQAWSGLTRLREVFERLRPGLVVLTDEEGRELFDLPDAPRPDADTPAPVRCLYDYDNLLLSHADRTRFGMVNFFEWGWTMDGPQPSCLLIDGTVGGTWRLDRTKTEAVMEIRTFERTPAAVRAELEAEGAELLKFWAPALHPRDSRGAGDPSVNA